MFNSLELNALTRELHCECMGGILTTEKLRKYIADGADLYVQIDECGCPPLFAIIENFKGELRNELLKIVLENSADVNWHIYTGETALHKARTADVIEILLSYGAKITHKSGYDNKLGETPLHCVYDSMAVGLLLAAGADVNMVDVLRWNVIESHYRNSEIIKILIKNGANIQYDSALVKLYVTLNCNK